MITNVRNLIKMGKIYITCTEWAIFIDLDKATLWEWLTCLEEQYPITK